jgi:hypothetical protein
MKIDEITGEPLGWVEIGPPPPHPVRGYPPSPNAGGGGTLDVGVLE